MDPMSRRRTSRPLSTEAVRARAGYGTGAADDGIPRVRLRPVRQVLLFRRDRRLTRRDHDRRAYLQGLRALRLCLSRESFCEEPIEVGATASFMTAGMEAGRRWASSRADRR